MKITLMDFEHRYYKRFVKVEFWISGFILALGLLNLYSEASDDPLLQDLGSGSSLTKIGFYYLLEFVQITVIYLSYLILNFYVTPALIRRERILWNVAIIVAVFFMLGLAFGSLDIGFGPLSVFALYSLIKYSAIYLWINSDKLRARFRFLAPGVMLAGPLWVLSIFFFLISDAGADEVVAWSMVTLGGIVMYSYAFLILIPNAQGNKKPLLSYLIRFALIILLSEIAVGFLAALMTSDEDMALAIGLMHLFFQLLFIAPLSWIVYKRSEKTEQRISNLEKELGQSTANLDFLRSQINPHFLFNALNTLYGTAIQENAERTGEGIQKLGDMMRFMLQENVQDKISLAREVEYLNNYISLQKLRTDPIPSITISTNIQESIHVQQIAPMLLIPFVENAFKHGISFREPSFIKISLYTEENLLFFDVSNSIHTKYENDPEKDRSGIGLVNVKQRLELLYAKKHELTIRESPKEFFVHLSITLS